MKKIDYLFLMFLAMGLYVSAQDTLSRPPNYCAVHYWPGDTLALGEHDYFTPEPKRWNEQIPYECGQTIVGTTLSKDYTVYGISIGIAGVPDILQQYNVITPGPWGTLTNYVYDTSTTGLCEMVRIYNRQNNTFSVARETEWCYGVNPVSWYIHPLDYEVTTPSYHDIFWSTYSYYNPFCLAYIPVYDMYFDSPYSYAAGDTLYLGLTSYTSTCYIDGVPIGSFNIKYDRIPMWLIGYRLGWGQSTEVVVYSSQLAVPNDNSDCEGPYPLTANLGLLNLVAYPIVSPAQNSIARPDNSSVSVKLSPNPTHHEARIESSSELLHIKVYTSTGHLLYSQRLSNLTTTINTRDWPAGVYIANIVTSAGPCIRKLIIN